MRDMEEVLRLMLYPPEERAKKDGYCTLTHNAFIDAVNIYVRYMNGTGETGKAP